MILEEIVGDYQTLVLEGCDGVGKSTLANRLSTHHGFAVVHSAKTPDHLDLDSSTVHFTMDGPGSTGARPSISPKT
jgi:hypothetical protein